ncbi:MAG: hypothetical protein JSV00_04995 [bacterium]|nr:MAG: hypothetical protein JSV00_04995 [bacterium]
MKRPAGRGPRSLLESPARFCYLPPMSTGFIVAIVVVGGWITLMVGIKGLVILLRRGTIKAARKALHSERIVRITDNASYMGADFPGPNLPPRTSGVLALTDSKLFFLPWFPRKAITLPRGTIASVSTRDSFGDMSYAIPALTFRIRGGSETLGEMAWLVHQPHEWEREIKAMLSGRGG